MTESDYGIGAATETRTAPIVREPPTWVQVNLIDKVLHLACLRCVASQTTSPNGQCLRIEADLAAFRKQHSLCTSFREAL